MAVRLAYRNRSLCSEVKTSAIFNIQTRIDEHYCPKRCRRLDRGAGDLQITTMPKKLSYHKISKLKHMRLDREKRLATQAGHLRLNLFGPGG